MSDNVQAIADASAAPEKLLQMMTGYWVTQAVYVAAKLGIADLLSDGPVSCDELASKTSTHARSLRRTLRALASVGVFSEVAPGQFALTPVAGLLRKDAPNSMRALAIMYSEEQYRAWGEMLYSVCTGLPAFERQFGMGVFEYFAQNPEPSAVFNEAMTGLTIQVADALAVDEHVDVAAQHPAVVEHPLADPGVGLAQGGQHLPDAGPGDLDPAPPGRVVGEGGRQVDGGHRPAPQGTTAALTQTTGGSHSASARQCSPSSEEANSCPVRVPK